LAAISIIAQTPATASKSKALPLAGAPDDPPALTGTGSAAPRSRWIPACVGQCLSPLGLWSS